MDICLLSVYCLVSSVSNYCSLLWQYGCLFASLVPVSLGMCHVYRAHAFCPTLTPLPAVVSRAPRHLTPDEPQTSARG